MGLPQAEVLRLTVLFYFLFFFFEAIGVVFLEGHCSSSVLIFKLSLKYILTHLMHHVLLPKPARSSRHPHRPTST